MPDVLFSAQRTPAATAKQPASTASVVTTGIGSTHTTHSEQCDHAAHLTPRRPPAPVSASRPQQLTRGVALSLWGVLQDNATDGFTSLEYTNDR